MHRNATKLAISLICIAALSACAGGPKRGAKGASERGPMAQAMYYAPAAGLFLAGFDTNLDFVVTKQELSSQIDDVFAQADTNGGNSISAVEFQEFADKAIGTDQTVPGRIYFDTTMDNQITPEEFRDGLVSLFDDADTDENGILERSELLKERQMNFGRGGGRRGGMPSGGMPGGGRPQGGGGRSPY